MRTIKPTKMEVELAKVLHVAERKYWQIPSETLTVAGCYQAQARAAIKHLEQHRDDWTCEECGRTFPGSVSPAAEDREGVKFCRKCSCSLEA